MAAAWLAAEYLWFGEVFRFPAYAYPITLLVPWLVVAAVMHSMGAYGARKYSVPVVAGAVITGYVLLSAITFFFRDYAFSRMVVLISGALNVFLLTGWRMAAFRLFRSASFRKGSPFGRLSLVVGADDSGREVARKLRSNPQGGYDVVGFIDATSRRIGDKVDGVEILGSIDNIGKIIQQEKVSEVIFSTDALSYKDILSVIARTGSRSVNFRLVPTSLEVIIGKTHIDRLNDLPFVQIEYRLHQLSNRFFKRLLDLVAVAAVRNALSLRAERECPPADHARPAAPASTQGPGRRDEPRRTDRVGDALPGAGGRPAYLGKPGLTSLADLNGKVDIAADDRERYDVYYAKNQSLLLDLEILMKSFRSGKP